MAPLLLESTCNNLMDGGKVSANFSCQKQILLARNILAVPRKCADNISF